MKISKEECEIRYSNWLSMFIDIIKPKDLFLVGGRGLAKTSDVIAKRSIDIIYDMPRAIFSITSDTYVNAMTNIIPTLLSGWERQKFYEDYHYVVDVKPPDKWAKPYIKTFDFKHTISTWNGCKFLIKSLDRPSANAGISTVHNFGDEAKYLKIDKLNKSFPTLRGDAILYKHSPYFLGKTFATDMPNPTDGEDDWILKMADLMDKQKIIALFYAALELNRIEFELYQAKKAKSSEYTINNITNRLNNWKSRVFKLRKDATFFAIASSFVNIDILSFEYIVNMFNTLDFEEFKIAILSLHATLQAGQRFYGALSPVHFFNDGYDYDYIDKISIKDMQLTSAHLRYINPMVKLEAGFDAGNMNSLVIGQSFPGLIRVLKSLHTLSPEWIPELGKKFVDFFEPHQHKELELYYDRAANNYRKAKQDFASQLKNAIEKPDGKPSGWRVKLMSVQQGNITMADEFNLMNMIMGEKNDRLPKLLIDQYECAPLKSSLELAKVDKNTKGQIIKIKKSEKKAIELLPYHSTNYSDAFKYLICRKRYLNILRAKKTFTGSVSSSFSLR